jgi:two-component system, NtrC family, response regulator AtoC
VGEALGFICLEAESGESALALLEEQPVHMMLSDMVMPHMSGLEFLEKAKKLLPRTEVALMTGHGSIETAVQAMKLGAYDYITKPFSPLDELRLVSAPHGGKSPVGRGKRIPAPAHGFGNRGARHHRIVGENSGSAAHGVAPQRHAHRRSDFRRKRHGQRVGRPGHSFPRSVRQPPFVAVDCGSLVPTLIESELFGYEKGAFTGALKSKQGLFQSADTGTVFLDEIGELPLELQAKLLRVLQEKEVRPVGSNQRVKVDVRVIAATNRDLEAAYKNGTFRKDLYFRLNVVTVHVPALRERRSDIPCW